MHCICDTPCIIFVTHHALYLWHTMHCICDTPCIEFVTHHALYLWYTMQYIYYIPCIEFVTYHALYLWHHCLLFWHHCLLFRHWTCDTPCSVFVTYYALYLWHIMHCICDIPCIEFLTHRALICDISCIVLVTCHALYLWLCYRPCIILVICWEYWFQTTCSTAVLMFNTCSASRCQCSSPAGCSEEHCVPWQFLCSWGWYLQWSAWLGRGQRSRRQRSRPGDPQAHQAAPHFTPGEWVDSEH